MDPITHAVTGVAVSKIVGTQLDMGNPLFVAIVAGSVFPDIDILLQKWGDYVYLKNHRGFTHSILGLFISSVLLTAIISLIYNSSFLHIWAGVSIGLLSHVLWDLLNSYGAKLLWPFYKKKVSYSLFVIFDPIILMQLIAFVMFDGWQRMSVIISFLIYLVFRLSMKLFVLFETKGFLENGKSRTYPSITNWFKWQFIVENERYYLVGERNFITGRIKILKELEKIDKNQLKYALETKVGCFFKDFTPVFHVESKEIDGLTKYTFMDLRYWLKDNFLHHATIEIDKDENLVSSNFCPYSLERKVQVPDDMLYQE